MSSWMRAVKSIGMIDSLISFLFPCYCLQCSERLPAARKFICDECFEGLPKYVGREAYYAVEERLEGLVPYTEFQSDLIFTRTNAVRKIIHEIKYRGFPKLGEQLAYHFAEVHQRLGHFEDVSAIVPIPLTPERMRKRGYNQSLFIAQGFARRYEIPVEESFLKRVPAGGGTQTKRGREERWQKVKGAFYTPNSELISGRRLLIVDDVMTSGATLINAGRTLLDAGAESVSFYTLALDVL